MLRKENVAEAKKYLEKIVKEKEIPGCSVLIVDKKGGKPLFRLRFLRPRT